MARKLLPTRNAARRAIVEGRVQVAGTPNPRPATLVGDDDIIRVAPEATQYVSRGGEKLAGLLDRMGIDVSGKHAVDVGASTGGFTDCLLQRGTAGVVAIDVGSNQLHPRIAADDRVVSLESAYIHERRAYVGPPRLGHLVDGDRIALPTRREHQQRMRGVGEHDVVHAVAWTHSARLAIAARQASGLAV